MKWIQKEKKRDKAKCVRRESNSELIEMDDFEITHMATMNFTIKPRTPLICGEFLIFTHERNLLTVCASLR